MVLLAYNAERREYIEHEVCRRGFLVLAKEGATFPAVCVKCGAAEEAGGALKRRRFAWHEPTWYVILAMMPLAYLIVRMIVTKRGSVGIYYCARHREDVWLHRGVRWGLALLGVVVLGLAIVVLALQAGEVAYMIVFLAGFGLVSAAVGYPALAGLVRPYRIDKGVLELQGFHPKFLEVLPDISPPAARRVRAATADAAGRSAS